MAKYRQKRMEELRAAKDSSKFGHVIELDQNSYVNCIDLENPSVKILINLYDNNDPSSRLVNEFFQRLALLYTSYKFCRIPALKADPNFDLIAMPAVLVYGGGELEISLIRLIDEIPNWSKSGICSLRDFEEYLIIQGVLEEGHRTEAMMVRESSDDDFDF